MPALADPGPAVSSSAKRVLVVNDNDDAANTLAWLLRDRGFTVDTAADGITGLKVAHELRPGILLLDIGLPGIGVQHPHSHLNATVPKRSLAGIPAAVLQFVARRIETVPELETLLIMSAEEHRSWSIADIAARTYVATSSALQVLQGLKRRGLAAVDESGQLFRFSPSSDEERQVVLQTGVAYRTHLVSIATFIHQKAATPVQEFARAFDLKKDD